jgi:hypothetical protein
VLAVEVFQLGEVEPRGGFSDLLQPEPFHRLIGSEELVMKNSSSPWLQPSRAR